MGYHLSIVKSNSAGESEPIPLDLVQRLPELIKGFELVDPNAKEVLTFEYRDESTHFYLYWHHGELWSEATQSKEINKLIEVAEALDGRLRGDELETYISSTETYIHADDKHHLQNEHRNTGYINKWKRLLIRVTPFFIFIIIGIIFVVISR